MFRRLMSVTFMAALATGSFPGQRLERLIGCKPAQMAASGLWSARSSHTRAVPILTAAPCGARSGCAWTSARL